MVYTAPHTFDLSTAEFPEGAGTWDGTVLYDDTGGLYFTFADLVLDPTVQYTFEVDFAAFLDADVTPALAPTVTVYSQLDTGTTADAYTGSSWTLLVDEATGSTGGAAQTVTVTLGPGIEEWDEKPSDENRVLFEIPTKHKVTAVRLTEPGPVGTANTDVSLGYGYDGFGEVGDDLTADAVPAGVYLPKIMRVHQSLPAPTLVDGRPT